MYDTPSDPGSKVTSDDVTWRPNDVHLLPGEFLIEHTTKGIYIFIRHAYK